MLTDYAIIYYQQNTFPSTTTSEEEKAEGRHHHPIPPTFVLHKKYEHIILKQYESDKKHFGEIKDEHFRMALIHWRYHPIRRMVRYLLLQSPTIVGFSLERIAKRHKLFHEQNLPWEAFNRVIKDKTSSVVVE